MPSNGPSAKKTSFKLPMLSSKVDKFREDNQALRLEQQDLRAQNIQPQSDMRRRFRGLGCWRAGHVHIFYRSCSSFPW